MQHSIRIIGNHNELQKDLRSLLGDYFRHMELLSELRGDITLDSGTGDMSQAMVAGAVGELVPGSSLASEIAHVQNTRGVQAAASRLSSNMEILTDMMIGDVGTMRNMRGNLRNLEDHLGNKASDFNKNCCCD